MADADTAPGADSPESCPELDAEYFAMFGEKFYLFAFKQNFYSLVVQITCKSSMNGSTTTIQLKLRQNRKIQLHLPAREHRQAITNRLAIEGSLIALTTPIEIHEETTSGIRRMIGDQIVPTETKDLRRHIEDRRASLRRRDDAQEVLRDHHDEISRTA